MKINKTLHNDLIVAVDDNWDAKLEKKGDNVRLVLTSPKGFERVLTFEHVDFNKRIKSRKVESCVDCGNPFHNTRCIDCFRRKIKRKPKNLGVIG